MWKRVTFFLLVLCSTRLAFAQDSTEPWFPGDDPGFYRYLEDRLQSLGIQKPELDKNGESILFEFYVTDSGNVDSVKVQQCFNFQLCFQLRQILNTMPKVNAKVKNGKVISERRVYVLDFKRFREGYVIEPSIYVPYSGSLNPRMKWAIALVAVIGMLIVIVK